MALILRLATENTTVTLEFDVSHHHKKILLFLQLPAEIRNQIYDLAVTLAEGEERLICKYPWKANSKNFVGLTGSCRQIRAEFPALSIPNRPSALEREQFHPFQRPSRNDCSVRLSNVNQFLEAMHLGMTIIDNLPSHVAVLIDKKDCGRRAGWDVLPLIEQMLRSPKVRWTFTGAKGNELNMYGHNQWPSHYAVPVPLHVRYEFDHGVLEELLLDLRQLGLGSLPCCVSDELDLYWALSITKTGGRLSEGERCLLKKCCPQLSRMLQDKNHQRRGTRAILEMRVADPKNGIVERYRYWAKRSRLEIVVGTVVRPNSKIQRKWKAVK
ncbi:hypothetical protein FB567DRAFT_597905 [Paraphoma chrysanthemicola]|uniref:Uncharacterized protein n=1 Tax=Paraphoma chrysanthemicola TaxID=798071 RepID=A0A8K0QWC4_9PLEO|nr:hypothetical protein FB567DRAFT_597905 [Paraphoma chrysanthemicola]